MRRIAFFGGSFDPPHRGHLAIATAAADLFALDQVLFATAGRQPFKGKFPATEFLHRYAMTALATQADPRFIPSLLDAPDRNADRRNSTQLHGRNPASPAHIARGRCRAHTSYLRCWAPTAGWILATGFRRRVCWRFPIGLLRQGLDFRWRARKPRFLPR